MNRMNIAHSAADTADDLRYVVLGYATMGGLLVLASWYYLERACFLDSSYLLVHLIINRLPEVTIGRSAGALAQLPQLAALWFEGSVRTILKVHSLTFIMWPALIFAFIAHVLRQRRLALGLLLAMIIMLSHGFFWVQNEIQQGIWWTVLLYAVVFDIGEKDYSPVRLAVVCALVVLVVFTHPLAVIPLLFLHGYWLLLRGVRRSARVWAIPALAIVLSIVRHVLLPSTYDRSRYGSLRNFIDLFPDYLTIGSNRQFLWYALTDYFFAIVALGLCLLLYLGRGEWMKMGWLLAFFFGYLLLVNVTLPGGVARFYMELLYQPLALFIAVPFALEVLPALVNRRAAIIFVAVICVVRLGMIVGCDDLYTQRIDWQKGMIERLRSEEGNRFLIAERDVPVERLIMTWGTGFESLLLSAALDPARPLTFVIDENIDRFDRERDDLYHTEWKSWPSSVLTRRYFLLAPSRYRVIKP